MKALDLFCGAGGASTGLLQAGFTCVVGVDINSQPEYFEQNSFKKADAFHYLKNESLADFDFIWASPPCQAYSQGTKKARAEGKVYPDLISKTREALLETGKPFVIENVVGAPLRKDLVLCGEMFGLKIQRHRIFECHKFKPTQIKHEKHKLKVYNGTSITIATASTNPGCFGKREKYKKIYGAIWKKNSTIEAWQKAMGINWIKDKYTLAQCVPPAYANYIGRQFLLKTM